LKLLYSHNDKSLYSATRDRELFEWDAEIGAFKRCLVSQPRRVTLASSFALSPDGGVAAFGDGSVGSDHVARLWLYNAHTGKLLRSIAAHRENVAGIAFFPDGKTVLTGGGLLDRGEVRLWDVSSGRLLRTLTAHTGGIRAVAVSPAGTQFASGSFDNTVKVWQAGSGRLLRTLDVTGSWPAVLSYSGDGRRLAVGSEGDEPPGQLSIWDVATGKLQRSWRMRDNGITAVEFASDGRTVAVSSGPVDERPGPGAVRIYDSGSNKQPRELPALGITLAFPTKGGRLATAGRDGARRLWDTRSGRLLATTLTDVTCHKTGTNWLTYIQDGNYDCSPGAEKYIAWQVRDRMAQDSVYAAASKRPDRVRAAVSEH
jgi:WD40 repeat protein